MRRGQSGSASARVDRVALTDGSDCRAPSGAAADDLGRLCPLHALAAGDERHQGGDHIRGARHASPEAPVAAAPLNAGSRGGETPRGAGLHGRKSAFGAGHPGP